ncbi:DUF6199 family natural product biosynthesis protein [Actinopolymorpha alba]|uniref:DUF6199 family natural product biosynthesis protein n=1 Tax=Actinopolymorpha alba TaxID=533267 RepID=UPI000366B397|nr:DUF6199 family natural product biosynthesis protein [Actinopolymorpha alba]
MLVLLRVFLVIFIGMATWAVVAPRSQWRLLSSWQYRDPKANEPSDASYLVARVMGVGGIIFGIFMWHLLGQMTEAVDVYP